MITSLTLAYICFSVAAVAFVAACGFAVAIWRNARQIRSERRSAEIASILADLRALDEKLAARGI